MVSWRVAKVGWADSGMSQKGYSGKCVGRLSIMGGFVVGTMGRDAVGKVSKGG